MLTMKKKLFTYILPATLVAGFLCFFFYDAFHYQTSIDDVLNDKAVSNLGIGSAIQLFFAGANGRWFSHIITACTFSFLKLNYTRYAWYVTFMMLLFVASIGILQKAYFKAFLKTEVPTFKSTGFAFVFTATVYFLLFIGRQEIWAWVSSANNHLFSVTLCALLFALFLQERRSVYKAFAVFLLAAAIGGLNEVNAVCFVLCVFGLFMIRKKYYPQVPIHRGYMWLAIVVIIVSLSVNVFSGGYAVRMKGLPDFTLAQSLKNTVHTFVLPLMQYSLIGLRLLVLLVFLLFMGFDVSQLKFTPRQLIIGAGVLVIISVSFFLHCYILSDIVPTRGEVWGYSFLLFVLSVKR